MTAASPIVIVIPALDEEASLPLVLADLKTLLLPIVEVIVVDNGSIDRTAEVARRAGATVLVEPQRGYGAACLRALRYLEASPLVTSARAGSGAGSPEPTVVFVDGDHSDHVDDLPRLLEPMRLDGAELVVGSRVRDAVSRAAVPIPSRVGNAFACTILRLLYGAHFSDLGPFRAIRWSALERLGMRDQTWGWTIEMQLRACQQGLHVAERGVRYRRRHAGRSKISGSIVGGVRAAVKICWVIARHLLRPSLPLHGRSAQPSTP